MRRRPTGAPKRSMADGSDAAAPAEVTLTDEQTASLVEAIENGTIRPHTMSARQAAEVMALPNGMGTITELFSANGQENIEAFYRVYKALVEYYEELKNNGSVELPEELEKVLDQVLTQENAKQLKALLTWPGCGLRLCGGLRYLRHHHGCRRQQPQDRYHHPQRPGG